MRVERVCGCGARTVIEGATDHLGLPVDLDVLLGRCNEWEQSHKLEERGIRERLWTRQAAVANIVAAFQGVGNLELSDEAKTWVMGLQDAFSQLDVPA